MKALLIALALAAATPASATTLVEHYVAAMEARAAEDHETYLSEMAAALELEPGHPVVQLHLGRACALTGRLEEAFTWTERALRQGAWLDVAADPFLEPLHGEPGWPGLLQLAAETGRHRGGAGVGFELEEFDLMPEGIEYDPVLDRFLLGSLKRKILLVDREGNTSEFVGPGQDGLLVALGLRVDEPRRRLWAVSVGDPRMGNVSEEEAGQTAVHCWSLEGGSLLGRWSGPADSLRHGFNDLDLLPDGSVVITDADGGALYSAALGTDALRELVAPGSLRGPNGIAVSGDGAFAYVAEYVYGVVRVDLATGSFDEVQVPDELAMIGIDGLYLHGTELVAVQNYAGLDRVAAFRLDPAGTAVESARVLEARHPRMDDPTTGVIVDGDLWYIANSHIAGFDPEEEPPTRAEFGTVLVLRAPL